MDKNLYDKRLTCPICQNKFTQSSIKSKTTILIRREYDLMPIYSGTNPLFYTIYLCGECGYANLSNLFEKPTEKKIYYDNLKNMPWTKYKLDKEISINTAIKLHKIVLLNKTYFEHYSLLESGYICLRLSWLYKMINNTNEVARFRKLALDNFLNYYENSDGDTSRIITDEDIIYLIAVLYFYTGDATSSKKWLSILYSRKSVSTTLKKYATDFNYEHLTDKK